MKKNLKWRLNKLPKPAELRELVKDKIITAEEAKEVLFSQEEERDTDSLKEEIKFLRKLVEKMSSKRDVISTIKEVREPWHGYDWYQPYYTYCSGGSTTTTLTSAVCNSSDLGILGTNSTTGGNTSFSGISTF